VFEAFRQLGPKHSSFEQKIVAIIHLIVAVLISVILFNEGLDTWFLGAGIVTPILLIIQGFAYTRVESSSWYREQMVPFISELITTTEIETDRYLQYHRRSTRFVLVLGWLAILICQWVWTFGLTVVMPFFAGDDFILRLIGELVGYAVIFSPFLLYPVLLILFILILEKLLLSKYEDIRHLIDIEKSWTKENIRRTKNPELIQNENDLQESKWD
jgi:hypothetical protein